MLAPDRRLIRGLGATATTSIPLANKEACFIMLRVLLSVDIDEPTKMAASATLRRAFLSSTVDIRSWTIHAIDGVEDHADAQLSLLEEPG